MKNTRKDFIIVFLITVLMLCMVAYPYIKSKALAVNEPPMVYEDFKVITMYLEDTTGTIDWNEKVDTIYTDDYGITHVKYKNQTN